MKPKLVFWIAFALAWTGLAFLPLVHEVEGGGTLPFLQIYAALNVPGQELKVLPFVLAHFAAAAVLGALAAGVARWIRRRSRS